MRISDCKVVERKMVKSSITCSIIQRWVHRVAGSHKMASNKMNNSTGSNNHLRCTDVFTGGVCIKSRVQQYTTTVAHQSHKWRWSCKSLCLMVGRQMTPTTLCLLALSKIVLSPKVGLVFLTNWLLMYKFQLTQTSIGQMRAPIRILNFNKVSVYSRREGCKCCWCDGPNSTAQTRRRFGDSPKGGHQ